MLLVKAGQCLPDVTVTLLLQCSPKARASAASLAKLHNCPARLSQTGLVRCSAPRFSMILWSLRTRDPDAAQLTLSSRPVRVGRTERPVRVGRTERPVRVGRTGRPVRVRNHAGSLRATVRPSPAETTAFAAAGPAASGTGCRRRRSRGSTGPLQWPGPLAPVTRCSRGARRWRAPRHAGTGGDWEPRIAIRTVVAVLQ